MIDDADAGPRATVEEYYEALRRGEPLYPFFEESPSTAKFGVGERLWGYDAVAEGLREQSRTTEDWRVDSDRLTVEAAGDCAWFADEVELAWTEGGDRRSFETRWSGTLNRRDGEWVFVGMHVSAPVATDGR
jgi:hypothetical protein